MAEWNIGARIGQAASRYYTENWPEKESGAAYVLESWPSLCKSGLEEIAGQFSIGELSVVLEAMMKSPLNPETAGRQLISCVREGIAKNRLNEKWKIKSRPFLDRLTSLTRFQAAVLELWAAAFWRSKSGAGALEAYARQLA
jgi:hypothetical protein